MDINEKNRRALRNKTKDELVGITRKLKLKKYSKLTNDKLIEKIIAEGNKQKLDKLLFAHKKTILNFIKNLIKNPITQIVLTLILFGVATYINNQSQNDMISALKKNPNETITMLQNREDAQVQQFSQNETSNQR